MFNIVGQMSIDWRNIFDRFYWRGIGGLVDRKRTLLPNWCLVYSTDTRETQKKKLSWKKEIFYQRTSSSKKIRGEHLKMIWWYVVWRRDSLLVIRQVIEDLDLTHSIIVRNRLSNKERPPRKKYTFFWPLPKLPSPFSIFRIVQYFQ